MQPAQPTLWRTCRVLANRQRLRLFNLLVQQPNQSVSEIARHARMPVAVVSQYLRALNARGLLEVTRRGRWVYYRPAAKNADALATALLQALRQFFQHERDPVERAFRLATAFTHPRRVEILHAMQSRSWTPDELRRVVRISLPALNRHLQKLERRGFVSFQRHRFLPCSPRDPLSKALRDLAARG